MSDENIKYLTPQGLADLQKEFTFLKDVKIPDIANRIDEAKQHGDLSENAEYHQAKEEMAWAQGRKQELQYILDNSEVMDVGNQTNGSVSVGSHISVKTNDKTKSFIIVGPQEADPMEGKISNESPLGGAFIGRKVGEKVTVRTPAGEQVYEILEVK